VSVQALIQALNWTDWDVKQVDLCWSPNMGKAGKFPRCVICPGDSGDPVPEFTNASFTDEYPVRIYLMQRLQSKAGDLDDLLAKRQQLKSLFKQVNILAGVSGLYQLDVQPMPVVNDPDADEKMVISGVTLTAKIEEIRS
jgi:hypothetical protein